MLRFGLILAALLVLAAPANAAPGHPKARLLACNPDANSATFRGVMWSYGSAPKGLEMRFGLESRSKAAPDWAHTAPPAGFDMWRRPNAGVTHFISDQTVLGLVDGTAYRVVIRYRWRNAKGKVVQRAVRRTPTCHQPDQRPNLKVKRVSLAPSGDPATRVYTVLVVNKGVGDAPAFTVGLEVNGIAQPAQSSGMVPAAGEAKIEFTAPRCQAGSSLVATADTDAQVDEADEDDNTLTVDCPLGRRNG
jgi:hypothetical protein